MSEESVSGTANGADCDVEQAARLNSYDQSLGQVSNKRDAGNELG
jgi:hypothetical protein